ncbi:MAG TPA: hypothetical protein VL096_08085 [Pirellulaceae bacterium]|nr:hypothetical protein [Pirellulaceae bacterium]
MLRSISLLALLALALLASVPDQAQAQSVAFSFGGGGHGYHHHHHCRPSYYFGYAPPPVYVYPRVVAPPVTYVYPYPAAAVTPAIAPAPVAAAAPAPAWNARTQPRPNTLPVSQRQVTIVRNPAKSGGAVAFVVDEADEVALDEGQSHSLLTNSSYVVEFDRGGNYGTAKKSIGAGVYEFVVTERGWDLVSQGSADRVASKPSIRQNELPAKSR